MRGIVFAAAFLGTPAGASPTCEQMVNLARIFADAMQAVDAPTREIVEAVALSHAQGGDEAVFDAVIPRAQTIRREMTDHANRAMAIFSETGCAP